MNYHNSLVGQMTYASGSFTNIRWRDRQTVMPHSAPVHFPYLPENPPSQSHNFVETRCRRFGPSTLPNDLTL